MRSDLRQSSAEHTVFTVDQKRADQAAHGRWRRGLGLAALAALMLLPAMGHASTIYTSFKSDATSTYDSEAYSGWAIFGSSESATVFTANGFTPTADYDLTQIDLGLTYVSATDADVVLELVTDDGGVPSISSQQPVGGDVLESWTITDIPGPQKSPCTGKGCKEPAPYAPVTVTSPGDIELLSGTTYWLVAFPEYADTEVSWNLSYVKPSANAPIATDDNNAGWQAATGFLNQSAFDVLGTPATMSPVPEPAGLLLLGTGLLGLTVPLRRKLRW